MAYRGFEDLLREKGCYLNPHQHRGLFNACETVVGWTARAWERVRVGVSDEGGVGRYRSRDLIHYEFDDHRHHHYHSEQAKITMIPITTTSETLLLVP